MNMHEWTNKELTHEEKVRMELITQVREIGESLIKNAESIVGTEKYLNGISISIDFDYFSIPEIDVNKSFYPEKYMERVKDE